MPDKEDNRSKRWKKNAQPEEIEEDEPAATRGAKLRLEVKSAAHLSFMFDEKLLRNPPSKQVATEARLSAAR